MAKRRGPTVSRLNGVPINPRDSTECFKSSVFPRRSDKPPLRVLNLANSATAECRNAACFCRFQGDHDYDSRISFAMFSVKLPVKYSDAATPVNGDFWDFLAGVQTDGEFDEKAVIHWVKSTSVRRSVAQTALPRSIDVQAVPTHRVLPLLPGRLIDLWHSCCYCSEVANEYNRRQFRSGKIGDHPEAVGVDLTACWIGGIESGGGGRKVVRRNVGAARMTEKARRGIKPPAPLAATSHGAGWGGSC